MDETLFIPHLAVGHILQENSALDMVSSFTYPTYLNHGSVMELLLRSPSLIWNFPKVLGIAFSPNTNNGELVGIVVPFRALPNLKRLALTVFDENFHNPK
jgi:hypothetical protein